MKYFYLLFIFLNWSNLKGQEDSDLNGGSRMLMVNSPTYFGGIPKKYTDAEGKIYYKYLDGTSITEKDFKQSEDIQISLSLKFENGNFDGAIIDANRAISINPKNYHAYHLRGISKANKGDLDGAKADINIAIQINPYFAEACFNLGKVNFNLQDYRSANEMVSKAIDLDSIDSEKFSLRGSSKEGLNDYKGAIVDFSRAIEINPRADYYYSRGILKIKNGEDQNAFTDFSKAIEINPFHEASLQLRGILKTAKRDYQGAITDFSEAIKVNSKNYTCIFFRGTANEKLGNIKGAIADFKKALEVKPDYLDAWNELKRLGGDSFVEPNRPPTLWLVSVGISNYQHDYQLQTLEWTVNGAHKIANLFKERWNLNQENLFILTNQGANRKSILDSLEVLTNPIKIGKEDMVIFFFSGHGIMAGNKIGICPWDYATPQNLISDEEIISILKRSPAKHKICFIEACKSNTAMSDNVDPKLLERLNLQRRNISGGLAYITSTRAGSNSYGTGEEGGFFTKYLLEGLEKGLADNDGNKIISIDEIFQYIKSNLNKRTNDVQIAEINEKGYDKNMPVIILPK